MRNAGRLKLGYYPLPLSEAQSLKASLVFPQQPFSALDPCVGDGSAFEILLQQSAALRYGVELDAYRTEQARTRGIEVVQGDTLGVQCRVDSLSFLYLNPPYDFEVGKTDNQRMELVFLRHTGRWLKPGGVLVFIIPRGQLACCARTLAEHFAHIRAYRLTDPDSVKFTQIAVLAVRRSRDRKLRDQELEARTLQIEALSEAELAALTDIPEHRYSIPESEPAVFVYKGLPLDEIEDKLLESSAYRQVKRLLLRESGAVHGRPLTPLHGGHVGLLCTAGMLNGVFGQGELRHVAHWQSRKYTQTWSEEDEGKDVRHIREYFSHECSILWANGATQILTHEPPREEGEAEDAESDKEFS
jgi:SAM-dependent methyltransferase